MILRAVRTSPSKSCPSMSSGSPGLTRRKLPRTARKKRVPRGRYPCRGRREHALEVNRGTLTTSRPVATLIRGPARIQIRVEGGTSRYQRIPSACSGGLPPVAANQLRNRSWDIMLQWLMIPRWATSTHPTGKNWILAARSPISPRKRSGRRPLICQRMSHLSQPSRSRRTTCRRRLLWRILGISWRYWSIGMAAKVATRVPTAAAFLFEKKCILLKIGFIWGFSVCFW